MLSLSVLSFENVCCSVKLLDVIVVVHQLTRTALDSHWQHVDMSVFDCVHLCLVQHRFAMHHNIVDLCTSAVSLARGTRDS